MMKDKIAIRDFAKKYFENEISKSSKTDLLCINTQSPENPRAEEIKDNLVISGILLEMQYLMPVVISSIHSTKEQLKSLKTS